MISEDGSSCNEIKLQALKQIPTSRKRRHKSTKHVPDSWICDSTHDNGSNFLFVSANTFEHMKNITSPDRDDA